MIDYLNPSVNSDFPRCRIATARLPAQMVQKHRLYISGLRIPINHTTFVGGLGDILENCHEQVNLFEHMLPQNLCGVVLFETI